MNHSDYEVFNNFPVVDSWDLCLKMPFLTVQVFLHIFVDPDQEGQNVADP